MTGYQSMENDSRDLKKCQSKRMVASVSPCCSRPCLKPLRYSSEASSEIRFLILVARARMSSRRMRTASSVWHSDTMAFASSTPRLYARCDMERVSDEELLLEPPHDDSAAAMQAGRINLWRSLIVGSLLFLHTLRHQPEHCGGHKRVYP